MSYSVTCSTKILTFAIAPFLFIFVGMICEFAMVPEVYILLSPQEEEVHFLPEGTDVHIHVTMHHVTMPKLLLNWKKHKQEIQLFYGAYGEIK